MELKNNEKYEVTVVEVIPKTGAVVRMEDGTTQLIHISNISDEYVRDVNDYVSVGETLIARCQEGKREDRPLELSLRYLGISSRFKSEPFINTRRNSSYSENKQPGTRRKYSRDSRNSDNPSHSSRGGYSHSSTMSYREDDRLEKMIDSSNRRYSDKLASKKQRDKYGKGRFTKSY